VPASNDASRSGEKYPDENLVTVARRHSRENVSGRSPPRPANSHFKKYRPRDILSAVVLYSPNEVRMTADDRYDVSGLPEAQFEPGSNGLVLKNLNAEKVPGVFFAA
jgi:hypothetical protein